MKNKYIWFLSGITLVTVLATPPIHRSLSAFASDRYEDLQLFSKVLNLVQQYYVEEVDTKKLIYGGVKGMLRELDPHTNFLPPAIFTEFESESSGQFGGLGIEITVRDGILTVISPIEDTPAWKAGIKAGDKVVEINGEPTKGLSLAEAAQKMRGSMGSKIKLGIYRTGFERPKQFVVERGTVKIKSVKYTDLQDGYGYFKLTSFIETSSTDMQKALKTHMDKYKGMKGMILDLRRNPGGLLEQAVQISDMFLESGVIVSTIGRNKKDKEVIYAKRAGTLPSFPLVVLIDEYSASASEILAGALKDNHRALIMGTKSFGKGSVQSVVKLGDGSALKLTVARYYTPSGRSIQAEGIEPDVVVDEMNSEEWQKLNQSKQEIRRERDMENHLLGEEEEKALAGKKTKEKKPEAVDPSWWSESKDVDTAKMTPQQKLLREDYQVSQAYNYLKAWGVMSKLSKPVPSTKPAAEPVDL